MLNSEEAIRKETEIVTVDRRNRVEKYNRPIWIFECSVCRKELRVQKSGLKSHSGKCVRCVKRNRHPLRTVYNCFLTSVKRANERFNRNVVVELTFEEFLELAEIRTCYYCDDAVEWKEWGSGPYNLDRLNNSEGYRKNNVAVCCFQCNKMKGNFYSSEEFKAIVKFLKVWRSAEETERKEIFYSLL